MRIVSLNIFQLGAIAGMAEVLNNNKFFGSLPELDLQFIVYSSLIQSGAERIQLNQDYVHKVSGSPPPLKRTLPFPLIEYFNLFNKVQYPFKSLLPKNYDKDERYSEVGCLEYFITDLLFALRYSAAPVTVLPLPSIIKLQEILPTELFISIKSLLSSVDSSTRDVQLPIATISETNVRRFEEVIESDLFDKYISSHKNLEILSVSESKAINETIDTGNELLRKNTDLLRTNNAKISLLPITEKFFKYNFSQLLEYTSKSWAKVATNNFNKNRRIVVYQLNPILDDVTAIRVADAVRKNPQVIISKYLELTSSTEQLIHNRTEIFRKPESVTSKDPNLKDIISIKKRRLSKLEQTAAYYGIDCPAHVALEIEDLRKEISDLENR